MNLTNRQIKILQIIIEEYINTNKPVSSKEIIDNYLPNLSSATIRNEMVILEKNKLIQKTHTSSGRIPSLAGYELYEKEIAKPIVPNEIKNRLETIFKNRYSSIDSVIDESASLINEFLQLPSVVVSTKDTDILKRFDLVQISEFSALIILITSNGDIIKNTITFEKNDQLDDLSTCVRVFNEQLVNTPLSNISEKLPTIKQIIREKVHEYEFCLQQVINKLLVFNRQNPKANVYGTRYITAYPEFQNLQQLNKVLTMLEDTTIWQHISDNLKDTGKTLITFGKDFGANNLAIASTDITIGNKSHQLSVVGSTRMNYAEVKGVLEFIKNQIEKLSK